MKYAFSWKKIASEVIGENEMDKNKCIKMYFIWFDDWFIT